MSQDISYRKKKGMCLRKEGDFSLPANYRGMQEIFHEEVRKVGGGSQLGAINKAGKLKIASGRPLEKKEQARRG